MHDQDFAVNGISVIPHKSAQLPCWYSWRQGVTEVPK